MGALDQAPLPIKRRRMTTAEYHRLAEVGVLGEDDHIELINGEVIEMAPIGSRHFSTVNRLTRLLVVAVGDRGVVSVQSSLQLDDYNEPEPDLAVYRPRADDYAGELPTPADTLLLIEVADSSARYDRQIKLPLYARCGVPELWIVDLDAGLLRRYREPQNDDYLQATATATPGVTPIAALPEVSLNLTGLLG